jgi:hypothetical protein
VNLIEAAAAGAAEGMKLAINVGAMLIAFLALLSLVNGLLGWMGDWWYTATHALLGWGPGARWSLEAVLGSLFAPFAWLMGTPAEDCRRAGELLGIRVVGNEFIAYEMLASWRQSADGAAPQPRTVLILTYALCGFANLGSIGIQIGGIGAIAPHRRSDLARLGFRAMLGGLLASAMTACVVGILLDSPLPAPTRESAFVQPNRRGKSSANVVSCTALLSSTATSQMGRSRQNSASTWRQAPHGVTPPTEATTSARKLRAPLLTAQHTADRSAQIVIP